MNKTELTEFFRDFKKNKKYFTPQQYRTIKGQALSGNIDGARKGMNKLIRRRQG